MNEMSRILGSTLRSFAKSNGRVSVAWLEKIIVIILTKRSKLDAKHLPNLFHYYFVVSEYCTRELIAIPQRRIFPRTISEPWPNFGTQVSSQTSKLLPNEIDSLPLS